MSVIAKDYKFGQKNNWRAWAWNRIVERLTVPPRDALVLYLAGRQDLDRREALRRGFRSDNLIAVERDTATVHTLRAQGVLTIEGDITDVLAAWPSDRPVHVVLADFCCGLNADLMSKFEEVYRMRAAPPFNETVFAVNLLRGRDSTSAPWRVYFPTKHRGFLFWSFVTYGCLKNSLHYIVEEVRASCPELDKINYRALARRLVYEVCCEQQVATFQYKSGVQYFDSIVFSNALLGLHRNPVCPAAELAIRRNISAVLAHRTRRLGKVIT